MADFIAAIRRRLRPRPARDPLKVGGGIWFAPARDAPSGVLMDVMQTPNQFLLHGTVWNRQTGFRQAKVETISTVALEASDEELGNAILSVSAPLQGVVIDEPMPEGNFSPHLVRAAGMKRWGDFAPRTRCVGVLHDGLRFTLTPSRNETPRHPRSGWFWITPERQLDNPSAAQLGAAVKATMDDCTFALPIKRSKKASEAT